ncbi:ataxin-2 isoform X2 [Ischnura elegans]|uniref:ataxin-2 isoform X2 n=1 Tax=Ischnura elegans TaxID=197161 RepID=UPI001ED8A915|nr:ataxin-2 isoform X2 [Ischnura elegans]
MTTARSTPNLLFLPNQAAPASLHSPPGAAPGSAAPLPYSAPPHHHPPSAVPSIYNYLQQQQQQGRPGLSFSPPVAGGEGSGRPPAPPVRDASSLKLKSVMERCDRYPASSELCDGGRRSTGCPPEDPPFPSPDSPPPPGAGPNSSSLSSSPVRSPPYPFPLPRVDRDGKPIGDSDYAVPSPPERDTGAGGCWIQRGTTRLTQADLEEYARTYEESLVLRQHQMMALQQSQHAAAAAAHMMLLTSLGGHHGHGHHPVAPHHAVGGGGASSASSSSYAHSEGYHSYVSSCDSSASASHTPFLDRLRRESEAAAAAAAANQQRSALSLECHKSASEGRDDGDDLDEPEDAGVADEDDHVESSECDEGSGGRLGHGGGGGSNGGSGGSSSGGETLKWHGSVGDVSVASSSVSGSSSSAAARQLIAHSARVKTPQRHHSESVLYLGGGGPMTSSASTTSGSSSSTSWQARVQRNNALNHKLRMFPVNTYTVQPQLQMATVHHQPQPPQQQPVSPSSPPPADQTSPRTMLRLPHSFSVAERIHELEKQSRRRAGAEGNNWNGNNVNNSNGGGYTYLDPEKRHRVSDPTLKAIQKKALLSYYERHHRGGGRSSAGNPSPDGGVVGVARLTCVPGMSSSTNSEDGMAKHSEGNGLICSSNGTWRSEQQQAQPQVPTPSQQHHQQISPTQRSLSPQHQYGPQSPRSSSCQQKDGHSQPYHRSQSMDGRPSPPSEPPPNDDDPSLSLTLPPQPRGLPQGCAPVPYSRRSSSASDYLSTGGTWREHFQRGRETTTTSSDAGSVRDMPRHEHSASCGSLPGGELGPLILGPPISLDHWVPERPPKKPHLRAAFSPPHHQQSAPQPFPHTPNEISDTPPSSPPIPPPRTTSSSNNSPASAPPTLPSSSHRCPSPDDPPPPPPPPLPEDDEVLLSDEPLPPPPPHLQPPSPQSHDPWSIPHGNRKSPTSCPPLTSSENQSDGCARSNGVTYPTTAPYIAPERHFFGENFSINPSPSLAKPGSPPPRPQQLQPWQPMSAGDGGSSGGLSANSSQSTMLQISPNIPARGVPAIRTLVKTPNQGFATSKSVIPGGGRERPPVMSRARISAAQQWRSTDSSSESSRTSPKSPPLSSNAPQETGPMPGPQSPIKESKGSDRPWGIGSQAHRRPNHWQVPLKSTVRKFPSEHLSPTKNSADSIPIKSPNRSLQAMNLKNTDSDDNRHSHSHENGVGDRLVDSVEENSDTNSVKTKSSKFQANLVGKAALRTQSKSSSYLSTYHTHHLQLMHRRGSEKGTPNFEGSYKRTLSPPSSELLHISKQSETLQQRSLTESNSENKNQLHQHVPGWEERVPDLAGGTLGTLNNSKDICESASLKGGRRSRLDHSWVKSDASWREEGTGVTERRLDEEDGTSEMDEGEGDGERVRRGRRRRGVNGRENGVVTSTGSQSRSLTASSSSSSSSTMSSFSVSSVSTSSLPGMSSLRSPISLAPYETSADSWVVSQSSPATQTGDADHSVASSGKADAASQTESLDEGVEVERRDSGGEEKGSLEEMAVKKERVLPDSALSRNSLTKRSSSEGVNGTVENGTHTTSSSTSPPSSPPPSPPKCSPPAISPPQPSTTPPIVAPPSPPPPAPQSLTEEAECERLSRDLVSLLPPTDRLQGILAPIPDQKRPTDYVSGLFRLDVAPRPRSCTSASVNRLLGSKSSKSDEKESQDSETEESSKVERCKSSSETVKKERVEAPLPATSPYFTTSEPKARFLARYGRDVGSGKTGLEQTDTQELQRKKEELMSRLSRKLEVLREEAIAVSEEAALNEDLGRGVATQLGQLALPHEVSRFKLHVDEVGKVTSLLLALSGRLARAENALALEDTATSTNGHLNSALSSGEERKALEGKRDKLRDQLEEAKQLKASIDRRSGSVSAMLARYLDPEAFADYGHFISMKAKLIVDAREVSDKIKLGEEQLSALKETLLSSSFPTSTTNTVSQSNALSSTSVETSLCPSSSVPEKSANNYRGSSVVSHNSAPLAAGSN